jgi:hypothetical protein
MTYYFKVWSLDQYLEYHLTLARNINFELSGPTPDLRNQKL